MTPELMSAIDQLYDVFSGYRVNQEMDHCDHCVAKQDIRDLVSKPVRSLTSRDMEKYASKAITTWGTEDDFKHFLPRLFELVSTDPEFGVNQEIVLSKLSHGHWTSWPKAESDAVRTFLHDLWLEVLMAADPVMRPDTALCGIGKAETNLRPYLEVWLKIDPPIVAKRLAELVDENLPVIQKKRKLSNAFWDDRPEQMNQVLEWLREPATRGRLEAMALANADGPLGEELLLAAERLELLNQ